MVVCINGETIIDLHQLEVFQEQQQEWTQLDIDLETIIAEIVSYMIQLVAILIGQLLEMIICGERQQTRMKREDDHLLNDTIFQAKTTKFVLIKCCVHWIEILPSHTTNEKHIYSSQILDIERIQTDVYSKLEAVDIGGWVIFMSNEAISIEPVWTIQIWIIDTTTTEDEQHIQSDDSRTKHVFQTARGRNYYKAPKWCFFYVANCMK